MPVVRLSGLLVLIGVALMIAPAGASDPLVARLQTAERSIAADPENLELAAQYRAMTIEAARYDHAIEFFETIAKRKGSGPNA